MDSNRIPLMLLALLAVVASLFQLPSRGGSAPGPAGSGQASVEEKTETKEEPQQKPKEQPDPWQEEAEVVDGFFGREAAESGGATSAQDRVAKLATKARDHSYSLEGLIVLVPDPMESGLATGFDEALVAVQEAYADAGYILDRFWLPWTGKAQERHDYRKVPGLLLFRRFNKKELAAVLVVGEVPRQGVHLEALVEALRLTEGWHQGIGAPSRFEVPIVGPYFSDSADSLRRGLLRALVLPSRLRVRIVSGSAMAHRLSGVFGQIPNVQFGQSIVTEEALQKRAAAFFEKLDWDITRVALLAQADTAFEQPFLTEDNKKHFILVRFPTGISGIRTAWEGNIKPSSPESESQGTLEVPKTTLDITLADRAQPVHLLPETGSVTSASRDLAISNLLAVIGARQIDYIGIVATDPRDTLFLAERIRRLAPSKILFIINNHLLFTHPTSAPLMNGTLVLSGYPLFSEDRRWKTELTGPNGKYLRQFTSSFNEGIYRAVWSLRSPLFGRKLPRGEQQLLWMSVIGNSLLWPIACLPADRSAPSADQAFLSESLSSRTNTKLIWFSLALCLLAGALIGLGEVPVCARRDALLPILVAPFVLWITGGSLAVLGTLPYRRLDIPWSWGRDWRLFIAWCLLILLLALLARFAASTWKLRRWGLWFGAFLLGGALLFPLLDRTLAVLWMPGGAEHFYQRVFVLSSGLSPLVSLAWLGGALYLWSLAELRRYRMTLRQKICWPVPIGFRARNEDIPASQSLEETIAGSLPKPLSWWVILIPAVTSSVLILFPLRWIAETGSSRWLLSVLLALTLFLGTLWFCRFLWGQKFRWELLIPVAVSPILILLSPRPVGDSIIYGRQLSSLLALTLFLAVLSFGRFLWIWKFRWMILVPAAFASVLILLPIRPIAETGAYGRLFGAFLGLTLFLGTMSFCRFLWTWVVLHKILKRLALPHPPQGLNSDLAKAVAWKPMKSFAWQIPAFGMSTIQAVDCLEELAGAGVLWNTGIRARDIRECLEEAMDAERKGDLELEMEKRGEVDSLLCSANGTLALKDPDPLTRRFYALRLISYIRYIFAHLRAFLISALACGFPLLAAASTYAYEPNEYVTNSIWSLLLIAVLLTLWVFYQMDRNEVLSAIADTPQGQVTLNRDLVLGTVTYGVVPLLGLVVAQFPNVGRYFVTLLNPLVRALGAGG